MKTTIILGENKKRNPFKELQDTRILFFAGSEREGHLYQIEHPEVDSYIIYPETLSSHELLSMIEHIHYLNSLVTILILRPNHDREFISQKNVQVVNQPGDIPGILKNIKGNQRNFNRIQWPVMVEFQQVGNPVEKYRGLVLSISSDGCFIRTKQEIETNKSLSMTFHFKEFDFYTEGIVLRQNMQNSNFAFGLAVNFNQTSPQTKKCIQDIINEKILAELMEKLNPSEGVI